ncbi:unnamed protein product [Adineta steineri]|uniref:Uncharacterized protein n=2 Tax=Adineta steineri TaxID=433720 RepID=A0A813W735_9BILA|nr:unnamed protein product [Adineta steineri]
MERKIREKQFHERTIVERLKTEYDDLRGRFEHMAHELRFSIEDELRIYSRLLDELMKKSSTTTTSSIHTNQSGLNSTTIRSSSIEDHSTPSIFQHLHTSTSGLFDLAGTHSGWSQMPNLSISAENLFRTNETEIQETFDGESMIRSSSYSTLN